MTDTTSHTDTDSSTVADPSADTVSSTGTDGPGSETRLAATYTDEVLTRVNAITADAASGGLDAAITLMTEAIRNGNVLQAFGTGHSEAFAMEIAGRAGGLIPTSKIALRDAVPQGGAEGEDVSGSELERNPNIADELWKVSIVSPGDVFLIASNSGVNPSIVGMALLAREHGHPVIAVTSMEHTMRVTPKHVSGKRLAEIADVVIDNRAPYGDATVELPGGIPVGAVSSITAALIAQLLTIGVAGRIAATGETPPLYLSANIPEGDAHNRALEDRYRGKIRRNA